MRLPIFASILLLGPVGTLAASGKVSNDATCGGTNGYTCLNSQWGNCCSESGWCGSTSAYCGTGCNSAFGACSIIKPTASPSSQSVSTDARCGPSYGGQTCQGSEFGDCCSSHSWCGATSAHCAATNCQKGFGTCDKDSSAASASSSISIASPTQSTQPSSTSIEPSEEVAPYLIPPTCDVLGTINKDSAHRGGLSKTQSACRKECLDFNDAGWKCHIYSMPTLYAACTLLLRHPAHPKLDGAFIKAENGNMRYWDVACEDVSTVPFTYPAAIPAKGCDTPGVPGRAQLDVPQDYGFSKTLGDCHQECKNYNLNGWRCRTYGFTASPPLCRLTFGKPAPSLNAVLKRESGWDILWWETTCTGAAPASPSIPGIPSPWVPSTCGMRGMLLPWGTHKFQYRTYPKTKRSLCKTICEKFNMSGDSCKVYGVSPTDQTCYVTVAKKAPGYDDAFYPQRTGNVWWFQKGCPEPDVWFRQNGVKLG